MKKGFLSLFLVLSTVVLPAHSAEFAYEAGAELVSSYLWRGQYNGGLSLQPEVLIGFDTDHTSFRIGAWANIGASDWKFSSLKNQTDDALKTQFFPEVDIIASLDLWGINIGFNHYYYCEGNFFSFGNINDVKANEYSSQTEVLLGYHFETLLDIPLYVNWYTMVSGDDGYLIDPENEESGYKRAFSSYIELGYDIALPLDITLGLQVGMTPWKSMYTDYEGGFAVNNVSARLDVPFKLGFIELDLFAQGTINTYNMNKDELFISGAGEAKTFQRLNGCIGLGVWF